MSLEELRLECLRLAHTESGQEDVVNRARAYADFVLGARDAEVIDAARQLAERINRRAA